MAQTTGPATLEVNMDSEVPGGHSLKYTGPHRGPHRPLFCKPLPSPFPLRLLGATGTWCSWLFSLPWWGVPTWATLATAVQALHVAPLLLNCGPLV